MATQATAEELAGVLGQTREAVTVGGGTVTVRPMNLAQIAGALSVIERLTSKGVAGDPASPSFDARRLFLQGGADVLELLAIATCDQAAFLADPGAEARRSLAFVRGLDPAEGARLFTSAWKANLDFFVLHRGEMEEVLAPVLEILAGVARRVEAKATEMLAQVVVRVGQSLSSGSSSEATASPRSEATPSGSSETSETPR